MTHRSDFEPVYAIGDLHGRLDALHDTHRKIEADGGADAHIIHLGDLIDRGPDSRSVIETLMKGQARGRNWQVVKGNHDNKLPRFFDNPGWLDPGPSTPRTWTEDHNNGADATFASYGIANAYDLSLNELHAQAVQKIPLEHVHWLDALVPNILHPGGFLFVHAGIRPMIDLSMQSRVDMMWIRKPFLESDIDHGVLVVHGHTAIQHATHYGNRLNIDSGAGYGRPATAVRLDANGAWLLTDTGARLLQPQKPE